MPVAPRVARALFGADPHTEGSIYVHGKKVSIKSASDAVKHGIGYLSEDRKQFGLLLDKDISFNTGLAAMSHFTKRRSSQPTSCAQSPRTTWRAAHAHPER